MKRLLAIMAITFMVLLPVIAESKNMADMSLEQLMELRRSIDVEIQSRLSSVDSRIGRGIYVAGKSIKVGSYEFMCTDADFYTYNDGRVEFECEVAVLSSTDQESAEVVVQSGRVGPGGLFGFTLEEGQALAIKDGSGELRELKGFWTP